MVVHLPLYTIAEHLQWSTPDVAEDKFFVLLGGMHTETLGQYDFMKYQLYDKCVFVTQAP